jgi:hemerythrin-like metal-binding protein
MTTPRLDDLQLRHEALDHHHKEMFEVAHRLYGAQRAGEKEAVLAHLHKLLSASAEHFVFEEHLMAQTRYPDAALHAEHHGEILAQLERFFDRALAGNLDGAEDVLAFVTGWLTSHLLTFDRSLAEFMARPDAEGIEIYRDSPSIRST